MMKMDQIGCTHEAQTFKAKSAPKLVSPSDNILLVPPEGERERTNDGTSWRVMHKRFRLKLVLMYCEENFQSTGGEGACTNDETTCKVVHKRNTNVSSEVCAKNRITFCTVKFFPQEGEGACTNDGATSKVLHKRSTNVSNLSLIHI